VIDFKTAFGGEGEG